MNIKGKITGIILLMTFMASAVLPQASYADEETTDTVVNETGDISTLSTPAQVVQPPVAPAAFGTVSMAGQFDGAGFNKTEDKVFANADTILGEAHKKYGTIRHLETLQLGWTDKPLVNGELADGAKIYLQTDRIGDVFPNGLKGGETLYAYYFSFLGDPDSLEAKLNKMVNDTNKIRINYNLSPEEMLPNTKLHSGSEKSVVDIYEEKDDTLKINEVIFDADFQMNDTIALIVYQNPIAGPKGNMKPIFTRTYKDVDFDDLSKSSEYTYVDLHVVLDKNFDVPESFYMAFKGYAWRPIFVLDEKNNKMSIKNPRTNEDLGNNKDSFSSLVNYADPEVVFEVVNPQKKTEFTIRVVVRDPEKNENIIPNTGEGKTSGEKVTENMTLRILSTKEINQKLGLNLSQEELNKKVIRISDAVAKELAEKDGAAKLGITGNIYGQALAKVADKAEGVLSLPIDNVQAAAVEFSYTNPKVTSSTSSSIMMPVNQKPQQEPKAPQKPKVSEVLNTVDHMQYILGYADGTIKPNAFVTRAELTTFYYRLLTDKKRDEIFTDMNTFKDVSKSSWYNKAISSMSRGKYVSGYPDGTFGANRLMTRAEFMSVTARFLDKKTSDKTFSDVSANHWAKDAISTGAYYGLLSGYEDGTFRPDKAITRAEAMAIINRLLDRGVDEKGLKQVEYKKWVDNEKGAWYYYDVIEATHDHTYTGKYPNEVWTSLKIDRVYDYDKYEKADK